MNLDAVTGREVAMLAAVVMLMAIALFLAMAETALTRITRGRAQALVDEDRFAARDLQWLVERPERWLNSVLLVVLLCQLSQAALVGLVADRLTDAWWVVAVSVLINVAVVFVVAEAGPKTWAIQHTSRAALIAATPVKVLAAFPPLRLVSAGLIALTNAILPGKGIKAGPYVTEEEILALAEVAVEEAVIEEEERELIESIIEFGDTVVREVMVPRTDMVTVDDSFRIGDALEVMLLNGYSRLPVCGDGIDDIVGLIIAKDLMRADRDGRSAEPITGCMRPARFVPETKRVAELLPEMQVEQTHQVLVVDEYGGTAGLATLEDLIEELVGEIVDEFDNEEAMIEPLPGGEVRVKARMPVDELNDLVGIDLPEGDWDSVGGLMFHSLGHVPTEGETVEIDGHVLRAERVQARRIGRVHLRPRRDTGTETHADTDADGDGDHDRRDRSSRAR